MQHKDNESPQRQSASKDDLPSKEQWTSRDAREGFGCLACAYIIVTSIPLSVTFILLASSRGWAAAAIVCGLFLILPLLFFALIVKK